MNVRPTVSDSDLRWVPKAGPVVAVANHPFGLVEGAVLASLLKAIRPDVKLLANHFLGMFEEVRQHCIFVDPFGGDRAVRANLSGLKSAIAGLKQGGLLGVFPAGEVAHLDLRERAVIDPEWNHSVAGLIRLTGATVLPIYIAGANSVLFQLLGFLHPRVRTALLAHELLNKQGHKIELRIGKPIDAAKLRSVQDDVAMIRYLRHRTYVLQNREPAKATPRLNPTPRPAGVLSHLLADEVSALGPERARRRFLMF